MQSDSVLKIQSTLGSNVYFINSSPAVIIDTGHPLYTLQTIELLQKAVPLDSIAFILCTHSHPDHLGAAAKLREKTSAQLCIFPIENNSKLTVNHKSQLKLEVEHPVFDHFLHNDERIVLDDEIIHVIHTPGHADDHCCFYFSERRLLFTGDLIVNEDIGFLNLNKPYRDSMREMNSSFDLCSHISVKKVFTGHGNPYRVVPWEKYKRKLLLLEKNPQLLIAHTLISPFIFYLWSQKNPSVDQCEQYIIDHAYLFEGFLENVTADLILQEFRKLLSLLEIRNVIIRNGNRIRGVFSENSVSQWFK